MDSSAPSQHNLASAKVVLIVVSLVQFTVPFLMSAVAIALPAIGRDLGASAVQLSLVQTAQILGVGLLLLPMGRFADINGRRRVFIGGSSLICVATMVIGMVSSIELFILMRFIQGIGAAMIFSTSLAILTSIYPAQRRGRAIGIVAAMVYLGMAAGPSLSGIIVSHLGWRWVFVLLSIVMLATLILSVLRLTGEWRSAEGEPFDWGGAMIYMGALFLIICGAVGITRNLTMKIAAAAGLVGMVLFFMHQRRTRYPIIDTKLLTGNLAFTFANLATFINYSAMFSFMFLFSLYLQYVKGYSAQQAGMLLIVQPLVQAGLAPLVGRLADSYSPSRLATLGMIFCTVGLFIASRIEADSSLALIITVTVVLGVSLGIFATPNMTSIMSLVEPRQLGTASSMIATMRTTGVLASTAIIALIFYSYLGDQPVTGANVDRFLHSQQTSFHVFTVMSLVGTLFSSVKGRLATSIRKNGGKG